MNSYEQILGKSQQASYILGGAKPTASFGSSKIGSTTQVYAARQGTSYATQQLVQVQPLSSVPANIFESGGFVDYIVRTPPAFVMEDLFIELKIKNNGLNPALMPMVWFLAEKVEVFAGTTLLSTEEAFSSYLKTMLCTIPSQLEVVAPYYNINPTTYLEAGNLAANTTKSYFLPVDQILKNLVPSLINEEIRIRVHYVAKSSFDETADLSLVSSVLWLEGRIMNPTDHQITAQNYLSGSFIHRYFEGRISKHPQNITASSELTSVLSSFNGSFIGFFVYGQNQNPRGVEKHTPLMSFIDTLHMTDATSRILYGGSTTSRELLKYRASTEFAGSRLLSLKDITPISVSPSIWLDWTTGSVSGATYLEAKGEKLVINTEPSFFGGSVSYGNNNNVCVLGIQVSAFKLTSAGKVVALR